MRSIQEFHFALCHHGILSGSTVKQILARRSHPSQSSAGLRSFRRSTLIATGPRYAVARLASFPARSVQEMRRQDTRATADATPVLLRGATHVEVLVIHQGVEEQEKAPGVFISPHGDGGKE